MESDNPTREAVARSVVSAAECGDRLAFSSAAARYGSTKDAQELVRNRAVLRMADRVVAFASKPRVLPALELRSVAKQNGTAGSDILFGHFTVWDAWYEVDSFFEGHFMERTVKGSTKKTIRENRDSIRALFQHGTDPIVADKPLGAIQELREDEIGTYYEVQLLRDDAGELVDYLRGIVPGLRDDLYGASFRFRPLREFWDDEPGPSDYNPNGLPERTLKEIHVPEFGPVTFPASRAATASVRTREWKELGYVEFSTDAARFDNEDVSTLAQMIQLGTSYIDEQDEPGDEANVPKMEAIIVSLTELVPYEVAEDEGDEPEDEDDQAGRSTKQPGRTLPLSTPSASRTPAGSGRREDPDTSDAERRETVKKTWQQVLSEEDEAEWIPRI